MLERNHENDETYFDDIQIDESKMKYNNEEILSGIWRYIFEYFQHINHILVSIKLAEVKITREKLYWCQDDIIVIRFVCDYDDWHSETVKITKIIEWSSYTNIIKMRAFIEICMYYWIWIKNFTVIAQLIYVLFKKDKAFIWEDLQIQVMKILKLVLMTASALKIINYIEDVGEVICAVDASKKGWGDNLMQVK